MKEYFGNKFGIKVSIGAGSLNDQINRVIAEQSFGRYDVDHLTTGGPIVDLLLVPANAVEPLQDWLFLPEVIGGDNWFGGELLFNDVEQKYNVIYTGESGELQLGRLVQHRQREHGGGRGLDVVAGHLRQPEVLREDHRLGPAGEDLGIGNHRTE